MPSISRWNFTQKTLCAPAGIALLIWLNPPPPPHPMSFDLLRSRIPAMSAPAEAAAGAAGHVERPGRGGRMETARGRRREMPRFGTAVASESPGRAAPGRRGVLRTAEPAALGGVLGFFETAALGVGTPGIALLRGGAAGAVLLAGGGIVAVIGLAAALVRAVAIPFAAVERAVIVMEQEVAHQRVLAVENPEIAAVAVVPISVLIGPLRRRRHVGETGRLGHAVGFRIELPEWLVLDGHAEIVLHGLIGGWRHRHPALVGGGGSLLGLDCLDLLVVFLGSPDSAGFHIGQHLVPGGVQLCTEGLQLGRIGGQSGSVGVQLAGGAEQGSVVEVGKIAGGGLAARIGGGIPEPVAFGGQVALRGETRIEIGLLVGPVALGFLNGGGHWGEIVAMDDVVVALNPLQRFGQALLEVFPMRSFFLHAGSFRHGARTEAALFGEQRFHARPVLPPVLLLQTGQAVRVASGGLEQRGGLAEAGGPLLRRGESVK